MLLCYYVTLLLCYFVTMLLRYTRALLTLLHRVVSNVSVVTSMTRWAHQHGVTLRVLVTFSRNVEGPGPTVCILWWVSAEFNAHLDTAYCGNIFIYSFINQYLQAIAREITGK